MTLKGFDFALTDLGVQETYHEGGSDKDKKYLLFCDGISAGGDESESNAGNAAAHLAKESMREYFEQIHKGALNEESIKKALQFANERLLKMFDSKTNQVSVSAVVLVATSTSKGEETVLIAGLGDCKVIAVNASGVETIFYDPLASTLAGMKGPERHNALKNCLGLKESFKLHTCSRAQESFQRFMILSHGAQQEADGGDLLQMGLRPHDPETGVSAWLRSCRQGDHAIKICTATFETAQDPLLVGDGMARQAILKQSKTGRGTKERLAALALSVVACGVISFVALSLAENEQEVRFQAAQAQNTASAEKDEQAESVADLLNERCQLQTKRIQELTQQIKEYHKLLEQKTVEMAAHEEFLRSQESQESLGIENAVAGTTGPLRADIRNVRESEQNRLAAIFAEQQALDTAAQADQQQQSAHAALIEKEETIKRQEAEIAELAAKHEKLAVIVDNYREAIHEQGSLAEEREQKLAEFGAEIEQIKLQLAQAAADKEELERQLAQSNEELAKAKSDNEDDSELISRSEPEKLADFQAQMEELRLAKEEMAAQLSEANNEKEALAKEIAARDEELATIKTSEEETSNELAKTASEKCELLTQLETMRAANEEMSHHLFSISAEKSELAKLLDEKTEEIAHLQSASEEREALASRSIAEEKTELHARLQELQEANEDLAKQVESLSQSRDEQTQKIAVLVSEVDEKAALLAQVESLRSANEELSSHLSATRSDKEKLTERVVSLSTEVEDKASIAAELEALRANNEELTCHLSAVSSDKEELAGKVAALSIAVEDRAAILAQLEAISANNEELSGDLSAERSENKKLAEKVSTLANEVEGKAALIAELEVLRTRNEELSCHLSSINNDREQQAKQILELTAIAEQRNILAREKEALIGQIDSLRDAKEKISNKLARESAEKQDLIQKASALTAELDESKRQLETLNIALKENGDAQQKLEHTTAQLEKLSHRYETLSSNYDARSEELSKSIEKGNELQAKLVQFDAMKNEVAETRVLSQDLGERLERCRDELEVACAAREGEKQQNNLLSKKVEALQTAINIESRNKADLSKKYDAVSEELASVKTALAAKEKEFARSSEELKQTYADQISNLTESLAAFQEKASGFEEALKDKEEKLTEANNSLAALKAENQDRSEKFAELVAASKELNAQLKTATAKCQDAEQKLYARETALSDARASQSKAKEEIQQTMAKLRSLESLRAQEEEEHLEIASNLEKQLTKVKQESEKQIASLQSSLAEVRDRAALFEDQLAAAENSKQEALAAKTKSAQESEELLARVNTLEYALEESKSLKAELAVLEKKIEDRNMSSNASLAKQVKELNGWLEAEKRKTVALEKDLKKTNTQLEKAVALAEERHQALGNAKESLPDSSIQQELAELRAKYAEESERSQSLKRDLDRAEARIASATGDAYVNELNSKIEQLAEAHKKEAASKQQVEKLLSETRQALALKDEEIRSSAAGLRELQQEKARSARLNDQLAQLRSTMDAQETLLKTAEELKKRNDELQASFNREQDKNKRLEEQLQSAFLEARSGEKQLSSTQQQQEVLSEELNQLRTAYEEKIEDLKASVQALHAANQALAAKTESTQRDLSLQKKSILEVQNAREALSQRTKQLEEENQKLLDQKGTLLEKVVAMEQYQKLYENEKTLRQQKDEHIQTFNSALQEQKEKLAALQSTRKEAKSAEPVKAAVKSTTAQSKASPDDISAITRIHLVSRGETLSSISQRYYGSAMRWQEILEANNRAIDDPDRLKIGTALVIP